MPLSAVRARAFVHHPWFIFHFRRKVQQLDGIPKRSEGAQDERSRSEPHPFQSDSPGVCVGGDGAISAENANILNLSPENHESLVRGKGHPFRGIPTT